MIADADIRLRVAEIQRFCMHDGPGLRTVVFLKGCPLRCAWCHNPEMQNTDKELLFVRKKCIGCGACMCCPRSVHAFDNGHVIERSKCTLCGKCAENCPSSALQICGNDMRVGEILDIIKKDAAFYGKNGGVTLSGGEPLAQSGAVSLLRACKEQGISTAVETCGYVDRQCLLQAIPYTDLFLWDIKDTDDDRHIEYTGVSNRLILENLAEADRLGAKTRLRCILVNGVNTDKKHYESVAGLYASLNSCDGADVLPYHAYGGSKYELLGLADCSDRNMIPSEEQINEFRDLLSARCPSRK